MGKSIYHHDFMAWFFSYRFILFLFTPKMAKLLPVIKSKVQSKASFFRKNEWYINFWLNERAWVCVCVCLCVCCLNRWFGFSVFSLQSNRMYVFKERTLFVYFACYFSFIRNEILLPSIDFWGSLFNQNVFAHTCWTSAVVDRNSSM